MAEYMILRHYSGLQGVADDAQVGYRYFKVTAEERPMIDRINEAREGHGTVKFWETRYEEVNKDEAERLVILGNLKVRGADHLAAVFDSTGSDSFRSTYRGRIHVVPLEDVFPEFAED